MFYSGGSNNIFLVISCNGYQSFYWCDGQTLLIPRMVTDFSQIKHIRFLTSSAFVDEIDWVFSFASSFF